MTKTTSPNNTGSPATVEPRTLQWWEQQLLERQGCTASDWERVLVHPDCDLTLIHNVDFEGDVRIGLLDSALWPGCGLRSARVIDCRLADGVRVRNIGRYLRNVTLEEGAVIEDTSRVEFQPEAFCGVGTVVSVLDETGSRPVVIYPGMSAQSAMLMARIPLMAEEEFIPQVQAHADEHPLPLSIAAGAKILGCGSIVNVHVGPEVTIEGARSLANGAVINNAAPGRCLAYVGPGVDADGFIIEDGVADSGALLRNVFVGQGARLEKGFTAHDSLFFANCSMENGEACALFAGPYTVSMHKGTLLIGCQTSFMNAGSSTNQSNHMYKLGPVHWGVLERGVKTSSNSYLMLGANIGAFSLLMGQHKTHPDSTEFPFSYLFGDAQGATVVVPAMMLRSCGLMRDETKWPTRDRRLKRRLPMHDRINFEVLNPYTVDRILTAMHTIDGLLKLPADDDRYIRYKGMKISRASLERARKLYAVATFKYLSLKLKEGRFPESHDAGNATEAEKWIDLGGQLLPVSVLKKAIEAESVQQREAILDEAMENYTALEYDWILRRFPEEWRKSAEYIAESAAEFDRIVDNDRTTYRESLQAETDMLALL